MYGLVNDRERNRQATCQTPIVSLSTVKTSGDYELLFHALVFESSWAITGSMPSSLSMNKRDRSNPKESEKLLSVTASPEDRKYRSCAV
ncbi:hypothetical protein KQX54_006193 [Cotesia glomerata]|uniref:Uncharacterized protein n=1 Tax=Cotesia glomerata TaxID=32391 RepID=A0AAV7ILB9_COTGL|nr:hypothetical protein KQX54_006193 [Cotesia glomerata]